MSARSTVEPASDQKLDIDTLILSWFNPVGILACALFLALLPEFGPNRWALAAALTFLATPASILLRSRFPSPDHSWVEPLFDLILLVTAVHFIPSTWYPALCIGLMVALAPSIGLHRRSAQLHALLLLILLGGMATAATLHDVPGWQAPLLGIAIIYPSLIFFSHIQVRRANALRERAQRLQGLTQAAGTVAHDFKNLLTGISGHAELALHELPANSPARDSVSAVLSGSHRADLLCRQLQAFSANEPRLEQEITLIDLPAEVDNLLRLLGPTLGADADIRWAQPPEPLKVRGDVGELQQVLMNVLINAVEAADAAPARVTLSLRRQTSSSGDHAVLKIADVGRGISKRQLQRIFEPFYTTKSQGQGLGLANVQRIMEAHSGAVAVDSEPGRGTQVTLTLPIAAPMPVLPTRSATGEPAETIDAA